MWRGWWEVNAYFVWDFFLLRRRFVTFSRLVFCLKLSRAEEQLTKCNSSQISSRGCQRDRKTTGVKNTREPPFHSWNDHQPMSWFYSTWTIFSFMFIQIENDISLLLFFTHHKKRHGFLKKQKLEEQTNKYPRRKFDAFQKFLCDFLCWVDIEWLLK